MVTTVTTTTVAINATMFVSISLAAILFLITLLIQKEIFSGLNNARAKMLSTRLNIMIAPLLIVFAFTFLSKVYDVLR